MDKRRYLDHKVSQLLEMFPVVAVIGARQCGKSTLVRNLHPEWSYYDLENPNDYQLISSDPVSFFSINKEKVIIDEAQQYPDLFRVLRGVIDEDRRHCGRFLITGSSSPEIVKGLTESLAGRVATIEMWPFKQGELYARPLANIYQLVAQGKKDELLGIKPVVEMAQVMSTWFWGGFPEPSLAVNESRFVPLWMENYLRDYINRDIRGLFPRLNIHNYRRFLLALAQFSGHQLNMSTLARSLEVSVSTVKDYLDIIHHTFLWRNLPPFEKNRLKKVQKAPKGYFRDQGLLHYLLRIRDIDSLLLHPVAGFSFESYVTEEIIRGFQSTMEPSIEFSYYRTIDRSEVDLVVEGFWGLLPVEIKLNSLVKKQSLRGLENFIADTGTPFGIVVNRGKDVRYLSDKVIQVPVNYL